MTHLKLSILAGALLFAAPLAAQSTDSVAPEHRPPPGMCRIWLDGVPANRQPEPTDCATAIRKRPPNARVIFGADVRRSLRPESRPAKEARPEKPEKKEDPEERRPVRRPPVLPPPEAPPVR